VKTNKGTPYKKTCMTRLSRNQDRTSMAHTDEHLNLTKFYKLQRITVSTETRWSIVNIENTWKTHDIWELYWQKMYKHSLLHHELHDRSASAQFSSCHMTFSWNKLCTIEIKITVIFGEKSLHHKWHGKWKFCWKNMYCYIKIFWENKYWCSLSLRILYGTISSKHAVTNWKVYKCTLLILSNWLFILSWLYIKEQNVSDFHDINMLHRWLCRLCQLKKIHFYAFPYIYAKASNIKNTMKIPWQISNVSNGTTDTYMLGKIPTTGCSFWALPTSHEPSCPLNKNMTKFHICLLNSHPNIFIIHI